MAYARTNRSPALLVSALFHAGLIAATIIAWPWLSKDVKLGKVVPVTLVTNGPPADLAPAIKAPEPAPAMAPAPTPETPPQPAPIAPAPSTPPAPAAQAKPSPQQKATPKAAPAAKPGLDLDALQASLSAPSRASSPATGGQAGPARPHTDPNASDRKGTDDRMSASEIGALVDKLSKLWNPNCQVEAAAGINVKVRMRLTPQGFLAAAPEIVDKSQASDPLWAAAAQRAVSAAKRAEPYTDVLKPEHYTLWRELVVTFNAKQACGR
jgi:hypothetical protein